MFKRLKPLMDKLINKTFSRISSLMNWLIEENRVKDLSRSSKLSLHLFSAQNYFKQVFDALASHNDCSTERCPLNQRFDWTGRLILFSHSGSWQGFGKTAAASHSWQLMQLAIHRERSSDTNEDPFRRLLFRPQQQIWITEQKASSQVDSQLKLARSWTTRFY